MRKLFLSYSRSDARIVRRLVDALDDAGYDVWIDRSEIRGGTAWPSEIVDAIDAAAAVLVALSPNSMQSSNVVKEMGLANEAKKLVLPVWIERTTVSKELKYYLIDIQQVDLATDFAAGLEELLTALEPIRKDKLDSIMSDPAMTTQEKIDAYFKARAGQQDPVKRRMAQLDERIKTARGSEREKLVAERMDLFQQRTDETITRSRASTARLNRLADAILDGGKRDQDQ
ncbi:MAG TPA: toll/interleukin-1 receptor domain-containing protein [Vicinamibacterales bacterium]|nr:toll/interleukin-1 receptor domain-containing protein [Vicinamibacterales bacterium]